MWTRSPTPARESPTRKAVALLEGLGVLREITGKRRGRAYSYHEYLRILTDDEPLRRTSHGA